MEYSCFLPEYIQIYFYLSVSIDICTATGINDHTYAPFFVGHAIRFCSTTLLRDGTSICTISVVFIVRFSIFSKTVEMFIMACSGSLTPSYGKNHLSKLWNFVPLLPSGLSSCLARLHDVLNTPLGIWDWLYIRSWLTRWPLVHISLPPVGSHFVLIPSPHSHQYPWGNLQGLSVAVRLTP